MTTSSVCPGPPSRLLKYRFIDCPDDKQEALIALACQVSTQIGNASDDIWNYLNGVGPQTQRDSTLRNLKRWFQEGEARAHELTDDQIRAIQIKFHEIYVGLEERVTYQCECRCPPELKAYYSGVDGNYHLCPALWDLAPRAKFAGLAHEMVHGFTELKEEQGYLNRDLASPRSYWYWTPRPMRWPGGWSIPGLIARRKVPVTLHTFQLVTNPDTFAWFLTDSYLP